MASEIDLIEKMEEKIEITRAMEELIKRVKEGKIDSIAISFYIITPSMVNLEINYWNKKGERIDYLYLRSIDNETKNYIKEVMKELAKTSRENVIRELKEYFSKKGEEIQKIEKYDDRMTYDKKIKITTEKGEYEYTYVVIIDYKNAMFKEWFYHFYFSFHEEYLKPLF